MENSRVKRAITRLISVEKRGVQLGELGIKWGVKSHSRFPGYLVKDFKTCCCCRYDLIWGFGSQVGNDLRNLFPRLQPVARPNLMGFSIWD